MDNSVARLRKTINKIQRGIDSLQKVAAKIGPPLLVPEGCLIQFIGSFGFRPKPVFHRFFRRWIVRSRTSSHTSPAFTGQNAAGATFYLPCPGSLNSSRILDVRIIKASQ